MSRHPAPRFRKSNVDLHELVVWMFERLKESPPFMITSRDFSLDIDDLIAEAARGDAMHAEDFVWSSLLDGLYFESRKRRTYETSAKVFHFLASLGEALQVEAPRDIPASLEKLLELLIGCQDMDRLYLQVEGTSRDWKITTTPLGEKAFGKAVEISFSEHHPLDGFIFESLPIEGTEDWDALGGGSSPRPTRPRDQRALAS